MRLEPVTLECEHCGDVAIESASGLFYDGQGGRCISCGFPGHVSSDDESEPFWAASSDPLDTCDDGDCMNCEVAAE